MDEVSQQILDLFNTSNVFEKVEWVSFPNKYDNQYLSFKDGWNFPVCDLNDETLGSKKEFKQFYRWLGERIALCLNLQQNKSNEDLRREYEQRRVL